MTEKPPTTLYTALLEFQRAVGPVKKDASNPAFRSKYATLQSVIETIEEPLHANGLVLVQRLQYDRIGRDGGAGEGTPILITELIHAASGEKLDSHVPVVCKDPLDPQKVGGALTYFRRYSLLALLNLAPEDDDGNAAAQPFPTGTRAASSARTAGARSSAATTSATNGGITSLEWARAEGVKQFGPIPGDLAGIEAQLAPLAKQVRTNDESLSPGEYQRYHDLEARRTELYKANPPARSARTSPQSPSDLRPAAATTQVAAGPPPPTDEALLDMIRNDFASPDERWDALWDYYDRATTVAELNRRAQEAKASGIPERDLKAAYRQKHNGLAGELAPPASIAG